MLFLVAKTMCGRTQLTMPCAAPEEGAGGPDPIPCTITTTIGLYRNMQLDPHPLGKVGPPRNVGPGTSMVYWKVIVE